ncbi:type II toxin-antitoxin system PemK/MazF family toxin [Rhizobium sp. 18055]|jgi:mRNA interferase MazF|uniref:type II toxin-antitoxin system PemK/MazF family toxin n=1 Tax=Rhizobium sp. 18055 TaxID=2681403 RepID=UPI001357D4F1|nr:type II toxin-antitoxin system PemK/MazF family toxin [Rhizobium sp. 18055]
MRRGDVVTVAASGDYGKPRPAIVITSDNLLEAHPSVVLCQMTSTINELADFRVAIEPSAANGLRTRSDVMADKPLTVRRHRVGSVIGSLSQEDIQRLNVALAFALGLSD